MDIVQILYLDFIFQGRKEEIGFYFDLKNEHMNIYFARTLKWILLEFAISCPNFLEEEDVEVLIIVFVFTF